MWTLTTFENPQRLADIMRRAWQLLTGRPRAGFGLCLRAAWVRARELAGHRLPPMPRNLSTFLRWKGGLYPCVELRHIGAPLSLLNRRRGWPLDIAARLAADAGYPVDDERDLLDKLHSEFLGSDCYCIADLPLIADLVAWAEHHAVLTDPMHPVNDCPF